MGRSSGRLQGPPPGPTSPNSLYCTSWRTQELGLCSGTESPLLPLTADRGWGVVWPDGARGHRTLEWHHPPLRPAAPDPPPLRLDDDNERPFPTPSRLLKCDSITGRPRRERGCFSLLRTRPGSCGGRGGRGLWGLPALTRAAGVRTLPPEDPPSVICLWPRALTQRWPHTGKDTDAVRSARKVPGGHTASTANPGGGGGGGGSELRTCCGALFQVPVFNPPPPQKNMHAEEQGDCGPHTGGGGRCSGVGPATGPTGQRG